MKQVLNKLSNYNFHFFQLNKHLFPEEISFIELAAKNITLKDFYSRQHISAYTFCPQILDSGQVNYGRFAFGKKTEDKNYKNITFELFDFLKIKITTAKNFFIYGVGWDYENNLIKLYQLSHDYKKIDCKEYKICRSDFDKNKLFKSKSYDVGEKVTTMNKDGNEVEQINLDASSPAFEDETINALWREMDTFDFRLDTYSIYNNKTTLYFD